MDETRIEHWITQLDTYRDGLVVALSYYKREKATIPTDGKKIGAEEINVQQCIKPLQFVVQQLSEGANKQE